MILTQAILKELLSYDKHTGEFKFKKRDLRHFNSKNSCSRWNNRYAGKVAGSVYVGATDYQCVQISVLNVKHKAHRLAWLYMTGEGAPEQIDHIDGNGLNNSWSNLRDGSSVNMSNISMRRDNKSGVTGVSWSKVANKWHARAWTKVGEKKYKHLGFFNTIDDAKNAIDDFRIKHGYSKRHGKDYAHYTGMTVQ